MLSPVFAPNPLIGRACYGAALTLRMADAAVRAIVVSNQHVYGTIYSLTREAKTAATCYWLRSVTHSPSLRTKKISLLVRA
jgi:hypothetical protein